MKKTFFLVALLLVLATPAVLALTITPLNNSVDTGVFRIDDESILYRQGSDFIIGDKDGIVETVTIASPCASDDLFRTAVLGEGFGKDVFFYCPLDHSITKLDYETGLTVTEPGNYSHVGRNEHSLIGVTTNYYWFSSHNISDGALILSAYHHNGTLRIEAVCNTATYGPLCGSPSNTAWRRNGKPSYPGSNLTTDKIYYPVYYVFGISRKVYNAYLTLDNVGGWANNPSSALRPHYNSNPSTIGGEPVANLPYSNVYYSGAFEIGDDSKNACYEDASTIACHNSYSQASTNVPNRFTIDKADSWRQSFTNAITLPNGTTRTVRDVKTSGNNVLVVYNDLKTELWVNGALSIVKNALATPIDSLEKDLALTDSLVAYCDSLGDCYAATGFSTFENPQAIELFARIGEVIRTDGLRNTTTQYSIPDKNKAVFADPLTGTILYDERPPFPNATGDGFGQPFIELLSTKGVYTEYPTVEVLVRSYDILNATPFIAFDCDAQASKNDTVLASNDYSDYTDASYDSVCAGTKKAYTTYAYDLLKGLSTSQAFYIDYDENACVQNLRETLTGTLVSDETFVQEFFFGQQDGIELTFLNVYDQIVGSVLVRQDFEYPDGLVRIVSLNGVEVLNEPDEPIILATGTNALNTVIVKARFHDDVIDYTLSTGAHGVFYAGSVAQQASAPVQSVIRVTQASLSGSDHKVGFGAWVLYEGSLDPVFGAGVSYVGYLDGYQYHRFSCDYSKTPGVNHALTVYSSRTGLVGDLVGETKRSLQYSPVYNDYVEQVISGIIPDSTAQEATKTSANSWVSQTFGIKNPQGRLLLAVFFILFFTLGSAVYMSQNYHETFFSQALPVAIYVLTFVFFAGIGFLPAWFIFVNIVFGIGFIALTVSSRRS